MKYSDNTFQSIWHKAGLNCVLNTYCTLIDCNIGEYGSFKQNLELTRAVLNEVTAVAKAEGVEVNQELVENNIENLFDPSTGGLPLPIIISRYEKWKINGNRLFKWSYI